MANEPNSDSEIRVLVVVVSCYSFVHCTFMKHQEVARSVTDNLAQVDGEDGCDSCWQLLEQLRRTMSKSRHNLTYITYCVVGHHCSPLMQSASVINILHLETWFSSLLLIFIQILGAS